MVEVSVIHVTHPRYELFFLQYAEQNPIVVGRYVGGESKYVGAHNYPCSLGRVNKASLRYS